MSGTYFRGLFGESGGVGIKIGTGGYADGGSSERIDPKLEALETITTDVLDLGSCISERSRGTGIVQRTGEQQGMRRRGQREEKSKKMPGLKPGSSRYVVEVCANRWLCSFLSRAIFREFFGHAQAAA